jgi:hypothetical protein
VPATTIRECLFTRHTILRRTHRAVRTAEEGWVRVEAEPQWQRGRCPGSRPLLDGRPALSNLNINCKTYV